MPAITKSIDVTRDSPLDKYSESRLYEAYLENEDSPIKGNKMTKFFSKNFNRLIPGKSIDFDQRMISDFVRKSKEMDLGVKEAVEVRPSVGSIYFNAQQQLDTVKAKTNKARGRREM